MQEFIKERRLLREGGYPREGLIREGAYPRERHIREGSLLEGRDY